MLVLKTINNYFTNATSGPLEEGKEVSWTWNDYGTYPVQVKQVMPNKKIVLEWKSHLDDTRTEVEMSFQEVGENQSELQIVEKGWKSNETGIKASYDNCAGWQHMALCLKAYIEKGIDIR